MFFNANSQRNEKKKENNIRHENPDIDPVFAKVFLRYLCSREFQPAGSVFYIWIRELVSLIPSLVNS